MATSILGICISVTMAVILISLFSDSPAWSCFLIAIGVCVVLGGLGCWLFGGLLAGWDAYDAGMALQRKGS